MIRPSRLKEAFVAAAAALALLSGASERDAKVRLVGKTITIRTEIEIFGDGATRERAEAVEASLRGYWAKNPIDGKGWTYTDPVESKTYEIVFDIEVSLYDGKEKQERRIVSSVWNPVRPRTAYTNYMETPEKNASSYVRGGDHGTWSPNFPGTYAHEFGHLLGLDDHYTVGADGYGYPKPGYETNIMANTESGRVEQINIDPIARRIVEEYRRSSAANPSNLSSVFETVIDIANPTD